MANAEQGPRPEQGVDALKHLAHLIAEAFVQEVEAQLADEMLRTLKNDAQSRPRVRTAGSG
jgi:hypothetical protein